MDDILSRRQIDDELRRHRLFLRELLRHIELGRLPEGAAEKIEKFLRVVK